MVKHHPLEVHRVHQVPPVQHALLVELAHQPAAAVYFVQLANSVKEAAETRQIQPNVLVVRLDTIARVQRQLHV